MKPIFISEMTKQEIESQLIKNRTCTTEEDKNNCFFNTKKILAQCNFVVSSYTNNTQMGTAEISYLGVIHTRREDKDEQSAVFSALEGLILHNPEILK